MSTGAITGAAATTIASESSGLSATALIVMLLVVALGVLMLKIDKIKAWLDKKEADERKNKD